MSEEKEYREKLADQAVALMLEKFGPYEKPPTMAVHWDDCDMDSLTFWLHFASSSVQNTRPGAGMMRKCVDHIHRMQAACRDLEASSPYVWHWQRSEGPIARYRTVNGYRTFDGYDCDTWIYKLTFYGG